MNKKVRYAAGTLGALPALGLLAPPVNAAATPAAHAPGKTVRTSTFRRNAGSDGHCVANSLPKYEASTRSLRLTYWSKPAGTAVCIGTIEVSIQHNYGASYVGENVFNDNGTFCSDVGSGNGKVTFPCKDTFASPGLGIAAYRRYKGVEYDFCVYYSPRTGSWTGAQAC
jgi:hypothetical protein